MLQEKLEKYSQSNIYPFHMPGHKRRLDSYINYKYDPYKIDITEIEGFDNLHNAKGILREAQNKAAELYGSKKAYYLINGSTCGILAAVSAVTNKRDKIIVARNSHKAVYNAIYLNELTAEYVYPKVTEFGIQGQITADQIKNKIEKNPDAKAVVITSPTYDGVISDVESIAREVHEAGMILVVDSAHGAHFGFGYGTPENVVKQGADVVIESVHKTLPAFTQTAIMHLCSDRVKASELERYLGIYETSSPSYVLMAGIESCIDIINTNKAELFSNLKSNLDEFYDKVKNLKNLKVISKEDFKMHEAYDFDRSKIIILTNKISISGQDLWDILLKRYQIQIEMAAGNYAVALSSIMDTKEGFDRLAEALIELDSEMTASSSNIQKAKKITADIYSEKEKKMEIYEMDCYEKVALPLTEAVGQISGAYINLYPPGIPLIVPGEVISQKLVQNLQQIMALDLDLQGLTEDNFIIILKG